MADLTANIMQSFSEQGRRYVESGIYDFLSWSKKMETHIGGYNDLLSLTDEEVKDLARDIWHAPVKGMDTYPTLALYADSLDPKKPMGQVRNSIDKLFTNIEAYRQSTFFLDMLKFCATFKELAPYNAMLVKTQMPSARYVLTAKQWSNKYQRKPKLNARPLVTLRKYGPIDFVFEIGDTESMAGNLFGWNDQDILEMLASPYSTSGGVQTDLYEVLVSHLPYYGIKLEHFRAGASLAAEIIKHPCQIQVGDVETAGYYVISVNDKADKSTAFASICHELGHLFCHHLCSPDTDTPWWTQRNTTWEEGEFEAEIVSYVICERFGIGNKSWTYLSEVIGRNGSIPQNISVDRIFKAANEVERMLDKELNPRTCSLYFNDKEFKRKWNKAHPASEESIEQ